MNDGQTGGSSPSPYRSQSLAGKVCATIGCIVVLFPLPLLGMPKANCTLSKGNFLYHYDAYRC